MIPVDTEHTVEQNVHYLLVAKMQLNYSALVPQVP